MVRKIKIISLFIILSILMIMPKSYAKIAIKPAPATNANNVMVNSSISNSYLLCQQMKNQGEGLYGTTVQPHLATNKDWGAVSYLSNSIYGTNTKGEDTGKPIEISGIKYYSTTGNVSGVMNWGKNPYKSLHTQTSALVTAYMGMTDTSNSTAHDNVIELENAARNNSKYVEVINAGWGSLKEPLKTNGMALSEITAYPFLTVKKAFGDASQPASLRWGLFSFSVGNPNPDDGESGRARSDTTFRPVVWN